MRMCFGLCAALVSTCTSAGAMTITAGEMATARKWAAKPPFSFVYEGQSSDKLLEKWAYKETSRKLDKNRTQRELTWADPKTGLVVKCVTIQYKDFPTVEWTLHFKNSGSNDTPIIENIQPLDTQLTRANDKSTENEFVLHHFVGSPCQRNDYQPLQTTLGPSNNKRFSAAGGRPTSSDMSYFNLEWGGQGLIVVVGWPGQWAATFARDDSNGLSVRAGQELTHFKLNPGEEVRSPMIVIQTWNGDLQRSYNIWRRWMLAHNVPKPGGKLPEPELFGCSAHYTVEMTQADEKNQIEFINRYIEEGIKIGHWWMDAGWYPCDGSVGWPKTGTWEVDKKRFPNGLRAISDYAHSKGIKTILWFEPERVHPGTWLTENHPEWILGGKDGGLLNLGNPDALKWLTDHVDKLMTAEGIDLYRQDFNMDPLNNWPGADAPDRQGITEIKHITGYLAYWDELLKRHPNMFIDSCASGGRRNDLETMRRAIPLWRTDYRCEAIGSQCHTYGISYWLPFSGTGMASDDAYDFRSNMVPFTNCLFDARNKKLNYDSLRELTKQFYATKKYWTGDYYPLTPYSIEDNVWMAWQFDCPEIGEGMVQAFRRAQATDESLSIKLLELNAKAKYAVRNLDDKKDTVISGSELMKTGIKVAIPAKPGAVVITYKKAK